MPRHELNTLTIEPPLRSPAVEGLKVVEPSLESPSGGVVASQRVGTAAVGRLFGPVMIIWFLAIGACGIAGIIDHPEILRALSPTYALGFLVRNFSIAASFLINDKASEDTRSNSRSSLLERLPSSTT